MHTRRTPSTFGNLSSIFENVQLGNQSGSLTVKETEEPEKGMVSKGMDKLKWTQVIVEPRNNQYMNNAVIYARVSSTGDRQSTERQVMDLSEYATKNGLTIQQVYEEHISGAKRNVERPVLNECLDYCRGNDTDILLVSELSRLGRNVDEVLSSIRWCKENHLNVYLQKENIYIYDREGRENPYLTIMIAVLGTAAQLERENIVFRLQSGRRRYVEKNIALTGKSGLGREGYRKPKDQKEREYRETLKLLRKGYPYRKVAKLTNVSESTVKRLKKEFCIWTEKTDIKIWNQIGQDDFEKNGYQCHLGMGFDSLQLHEKKTAWERSFLFVEH